MPRLTIIFNLLFYILFSLSSTVLHLNCSVPERNPLRSKVICIDPGHGGTAAIDSYRVGSSGEREEWINLRVALKLSDMLKDAGAIVVLTRNEDTAVKLRARADLAVRIRADLFISIHHNATADTLVNFPIIYYHENASENKASVLFGRLLARQFRKEFYQSEVPLSLVSDQVIFPVDGAAVLRYSYGIPGVIGEASFFTNRAEEQRLKNLDYNAKEARAYFLAIKKYFQLPARNILAKNSITTISPFEVFKEAERMNPVALNWQTNYRKGAFLARSGELDSLKKAEELLKMSIKSFPDSWLAEKAHKNWIKVLLKLKKYDQADSIMQRVNEFYIDPDFQD